MKSTAEIQGKKIIYIYVLYITVASGRILSQAIKGKFVFLFPPEHYTLTLTWALFGFVISPQIVRKINVRLNVLHSRHCNYIFESVVVRVFRPKRMKSEPSPGVLTVSAVCVLSSLELCSGTRALTCINTTHTNNLSERKHSKSTSPRP